MDTQAFIAKWSVSGASERANKDSFLLDLCDLLGTARPNPATGDRERDLFVFEADALVPHEGGRVTVGKIDLYKEKHLILETKQGSEEGSKKVGTAKRETPAWHIAMRDAFGQALGYARTLDSPPPFLIACDIGYCFDIYAAFDGSTNYRPFPSARTSRIHLQDIERHRDTLRVMFEAPLSLDPSNVLLQVTTTVATHLADLAKSLEAAGHASDSVAQFLMRCIFTMFAEDVGLLPTKLFLGALEDHWLANPDSFKTGVEALWRAMNEGTGFGFVGKLLRFNGGLFADSSAITLSSADLRILRDAARCQWSDVDPAIFGTLLERALDPLERHKLGAHFTPRPFVERLVGPTIEEPLREEWTAGQAAIRALVGDGRVEAARAIARQFHQKLCHTHVLDPACGSGNFLYVSLEIFKRLESEVLQLLAALGDTQHPLDVHGATVTPAQFHGLEVKAWAKEIADLVLWIGYLQWHYRARGNVSPPEPILQDYRNIERRDAVLSYTGTEPVIDDDGRPLTRWDGRTYAPDPTTGAMVPDNTARVPVVRLLDPKPPAPWPTADYVVGNPPFLGNKRMRAVLGSGYVDALRKVHPDMPDASDFVMYWWNHAADLVRLGSVSRFGLITTKTITQTYGRRIVERHLRDTENPLSLVFAVPNHPWVDSEQGAAVRIAMSVGERGAHDGVLATVASGEEKRVPPRLVLERGRINPDFTLGVDLTKALPLRANAGLSFMGVTLEGQGFVLEPSDALVEESTTVVRPYMIGADFTRTPRTRYVIDLYWLTEAQTKERYPALYQRVYTTVRLERLAKAANTKDSAAYAEKWWWFAKPRPEMRTALAGLERYVVTCRTGNHFVFQFCSASTLVESTVIAFAFDDAFHLGVLSSSTHQVWARRKAGRHGVGNQPRYNNTQCFETFPFPQCDEVLKTRIREVAERIDRHRKDRQALHTGLSLTAIYNVLGRLMDPGLGGVTLSPQERRVYDGGAVLVLMDLHRTLDSLVLQAYGWEGTAPSEDVIGARLAALNAERVTEEEHGRVRWLRRAVAPGVEEPTQLLVTGLEMPRQRGVRPAWPKSLAAQVTEVRDLLAAAAASLTLDEVRAAFDGAKAKELETVLESLTALGVAVMLKSREGSRRWRGLARSN